MNLIAGSANESSEIWSAGLATNITFDNLLNITANNSETKNLEDFYDADSEGKLFDRWDVRVAALTIYTIVFCSCFFGNLMVILVVTLHWRMRSITNFCLANLAIADLCVGVFCVYQNLVQYLIKNWVFGTFFCKMYHFIDRLSQTTSILILVVICVERYLAIIHPMRCKQMLTLGRLKLTILCVWIASAIINSPRLYYIKTITITNSFNNNHPAVAETMCIADRTLFNSKTSDLIIFAVQYLIPLAIITVLYTLIGVALWRSSRAQMPQNEASGELSSSSSNPDSDGSTTTRQSKRKRHYRTNKNFTRLFGWCIRRDRSPGEPPPPNPATEQIVVVKFEKKSSMKNSNSKKNSCTIVLAVNNPTLLTNGNSNHNLSFHENGRLEKNPESPCPNSSSNCSGQGSRFSIDSPDGSEIMENKSNVTFNFNENLLAVPTAPHVHQPRLKRMRVIRGSKYGTRALESRRKIIRMLVVIVFTFAICNFPFHARKLWQIYGKSYSGGSNFATLLTMFTNLALYANSGVNPILYAFMSKKFRQSFVDFLYCKMKRSLRVTRNASVRSTNVIPLTSMA